MGIADDDFLGSHMVPLLNATRIDAACLGNHDLDFGMEQFEYLAKKCTFPWLVANVLDPALGEGERTALILVGQALAQEGFAESRLYAGDYDRRFRPVGTAPRFPE